LTSQVSHCLGIVPEPSLVPQVSWGLMVKFCLTAGRVTLLGQNMFQSLDFLALWILYMYMYIDNTHMNFNIMYYELILMQYINIYIYIHAYICICIRESIS
jgi:hypothetical protein